MSDPNKKFAFTQRKLLLFKLNNGNKKASIPTDNHNVKYDLFTGVLSCSDYPPRFSTCIYSILKYTYQFNDNLKCICND